MRIVTNGRDEFAIQKGVFFKRYYDLKHHCFWRKTQDVNFTDCWSDKENVERIYYKLNPLPVKINLNINE